MSLPATARIGQGRGPDRGLKIAALLVVAGIGLVVAKPWAWLPPAVAPPDASAAPSWPPAGPPSAAATATSSMPSGGLDARLGCMSDSLWTAVVDEIGAGGRSLTRSWIRLEPVTAAGPDDPGITTVRLFTGAVPRLGFCAPVRGTPGALDRPIAVTAWRLERDGPSGRATSIRLTMVAVSGGTARDGGTLYAPPAAADDAPTTGVTGDPEAAWAVDAPPWRPGSWSTGPAPTVGWPPGTYVLAVEPPAVSPGQDGVRWFAIELRGPWTSPATSPPAIAPAASPSGRPPGDPAATPAPPG